MIRWADIPTAAKMTATVIPILGGAVVWMFSTFETAGASEQKWQAHNQAITCRTVYELQSQIRAYLERLRFDGALSPNDRLWIEQEIVNLQADIKRLDPNGIC